MICRDEESGDWVTIPFTAEGVRVLGASFAGKTMKASLSYAKAYLLHHAKKNLDRSQERGAALAEAVTWQITGWDKELHDLTTDFAGQTVNGWQFIEKAQLAGYTDYFEHPDKPGPLVLCLPSHGMDGSEIVMPRESQLGKAIETYYSREGWEFGIPARYPYQSDREAVQAGLEAGIPVPAEIMMLYPDLVARFGL